MRALVLTHRWLGIVCSCFFAMWFASGIVMHFVPFPQLSEAERFSGLAAIKADPSSMRPADEVVASAGGAVKRLRLLQRQDGPVYILTFHDGRLSALHAGDLESAAVRDHALARRIAEDHARRRGLAGARASVVALASHDQWSVPNGLDPHRPLFRIALDDGAGTEVYVSSQTGEIVRDTTRFERSWNYVGSVVHWIYPTVLRKNWLAWDRTVWAVALVAVLVALSGAALGILRIRWVKGRPKSPFPGWHGWHHVLGLVTMIFVVTWIFSGWLSMDHGRLFSTGRATPADLAAISGALTGPSGRPLANGPFTPGSREIEWFHFGDTHYRRDRIDSDAQALIAADRGDAAVKPRAALTAGEIEKAVARTGRSCGLPGVVGQADAYPIPGSGQGRVYRSICGDDWLHVDAASGDVLERLDRSRRAYRWLYSALHTLDLPTLTQRPYLRSAIVVLLCSLGLAFSVSGIVIGWRRLTLGRAR